MNSLKFLIIRQKIWRRSLISLLNLGRNTPFITLVENTCKYCKVFKNSFFYRTPLLATSGMKYSPNQDIYYHPHALQIHSLFLHDGNTELILYESFPKQRQNSIKNKISVIHNDNVNEIKASFCFIYGLKNIEIHMTI